MDINVLCTQNWSRMFNVWIEDIQVIGLPAAITPLEIQRCFLRKVRSFARHLSCFVVLLFALHCSNPRSTPEREAASAPPAQPPADPPRDSAPALASGSRQAPPVRIERGVASWYGGDDDGFAGGVTASGETYDPGEFTCAHRTLPFGTWVEVENMRTHKRAVLRVNDRGPFVRGRILDMSPAAAQVLGMLHPGVAPIRLRTLDGRVQPVPGLPAAQDGDPYTIRLAALANPAHLTRVGQEMETAYGPATFQVVQGPGRPPVRRMRVGSFMALEDAQTAMEHIAKFCKDRGLEPFVERKY